MLMYTVEKNIPTDYDLSNLPIEFFRKIYALNYFIVSSHKDGSIKIQNAHTAKLVASLDGHRDWVRSVAISSDNRLIASGSDDRYIKIWDSRTYELLHKLSGHNAWIDYVAFSHNNLRIVSCGRDNNINIWDVRTARLETSFHGYDCICAAFSHNDLRIVLVNSASTIQILDSNTGQVLNTLNPVLKVYNAIFSSDDSQIISYSRNGNIQMWNSETGQLVRTMNSNVYLDQSIYCYEFGSYGMAMSSDNLKIVFGIGDCINLWSTESGKLLKKFNAESPIVCVTFSPDNSQIVFNDKNGMIKIWEAETDNLLDIFRESPNSLCLSLTRVAYCDELNLRIQAHMNNHMSNH